MIGTSFVMVWWALGLRLAVILIGGIVAAVIVAAAFFTILFIVRRHPREPVVGEWPAVGERPVTREMGDVEDSA
ncbi:MAG TPA: hypothetical protein VF877_10860 [Gaiellaceae bacterium]